MIKVTYQETKGYFVHHKSFGTYEKALLFAERIKNNAMYRNININGVPVCNN